MQKVNVSDCTALARYASHAQPMAVLGARASAGRGERLEESSCGKTEQYHRNPNNCKNKQHLVLASVQTEASEGRLQTKLGFA